MVRLVEDGVGATEIARRFRRSPEMIDRIVGMAALTVGSTGPSPRRVLRPLESRVLRWRDEGADYHEIGTRFRRSAEAVQQVERLARYKLDHA